MQINTHAYEVAHGKKPRGYGHWAFFFRGFDQVKDTFWFQGKYGDAVKAARIEACKRNVSEIVVGS